MLIACSRDVSERIIIAGEYVLKNKKHIRYLAKYERSLSCLHLYNNSDKEVFDFIMQISFVSQYTLTGLAFSVGL